MDDHEQYLLLLLSDSNLPTGAFVASSGLESYAKHGFVASVPPFGYEASVANFIQDSLESYGRTTLPFVADAHIAVHELSEAHADSKSTSGTVKAERGGLLVGEEGKGAMLTVEQTLRTLVDLDELYQTMTLNHVSRRASMSQGVALLNLYSKGFSRPAFVSPVQPTPRPLGLGETHASHDSHQEVLRSLVDKFKLLVRKESTFGHLPICWGILTAALGLSLGKSLISKTPHTSCNNYTNKTWNRTRPIPSFVPSRKEFALSLRSAE